MCFLILCKSWGSERWEASERPRGLRGFRGLRAFWRPKLWSSSPKDIVHSVGFVWFSCVFLFWVYLRWVCVPGFFVYYVMWWTCIFSILFFEMPDLNFSAPRKSSRLYWLFKALFRLYVRLWWGGALEYFLETSSRIFCIMGFIFREVSHDFSFICREIHFFRFIFWVPRRGPLCGEAETHAPKVLKLQLYSVLSRKKYVLADILGCGPLGEVYQLCCMLPPPPAERERECVCEWERERDYQLCSLPGAPPLHKTCLAAT